MTDALFVYGTLMKGFPLHHLLEGSARFLGEGQIKARLFSLGDFPGAVEDPRGVVFGEVYQSDRMTDLLVRIDEEEEYDPGDEQGSLFIRREVPVRLLEDGAPAADVEPEAAVLPRHVRGEDAGAARRLLELGSKRGVEAVAVTAVAGLGRDADVADEGADASGELLGLRHEREVDHDCAPPIGVA